MVGEILLFYIIYSQHQLTRSLNIAVRACWYLKERLCALVKLKHNLLTLLLCNCLSNFY